MILLTRQQRYIASLLTGVLLGLSFPFTGSLTPLVFIAWVPLFTVGISLKSDAKKPRHFFIHALISMLVFNIWTTWWIWNSTHAGAIMAFVSNGLLMTGALTLAYRITRKKGKLHYLIFTSLLWLSFEYAHLNWELSWPWLTMGNFFSIRPTWVQWYEYTGILGGSLWVMCINVLLTLMLCLPAKRNLLVYVTLGSMAAPLFCSILLLQNLQNRTQHAFKQNLRIIQPNIDPYKDKFGGMSAEAQLERMIEMASGAPNDSLLILCPETAIQEYFVENQFKNTKSYKLLKEKLIEKKHCKILIGASTFKIFDKKYSAASREIPNEGFYESYNSSLYFSEKKINFVHKSKLVLGVEKVPFISLLPFLEKYAIELEGGSGSLGTERYPKMVRDGRLKLAPIVCYESIYGEFIGKQVKQGANLLCVITNDGWWGNTPGYKQHNSFSALRAIENRKYLVRSGNTGISSVFNPNGNCLTATKFDTQDYIDMKIPLLEGLTFYTRQGDFLGKAALLASGVLLMFYFFKRKKPNRS